MLSRDWLLSVMFDKVHPCCRGWASILQFSLLLDTFRWTYRPHFLYPPIRRWTSALCSHHLAVVNNADINIHGQVFVWTCISGCLESTPRSRIAESYHNPMVNLLRNCPIIFSKQLPHFTFPSVLYEALISPHPCQHL